jgi:UDP-N-acetylmuramoyl-L-alanyl-D-glutamate--2,6-diaminopimelate ligase
VKLSELTGEIERKGMVPEEVVPLPERDPDITSIHYRSQTVLSGGLFVAMVGRSADGHHYIEDAVNRGAAAVISEKIVDIPVPAVIVGNSRKALGIVSSRFYRHPSLSLCVIGVTGTNGKTTTTYIIESILKAAGLNVGVIGTIEYRYNNIVGENAMTTPESLDLQEILFEMVKSGVTHVVMEVSSHAIEFNRTHNCWLDVGVFTNLSQDHLDFHNTMAAYWQSKKRLFTEILVSGPKHKAAVAVINYDDDKGVELYREVQIKKISVGFDKSCDLALKTFRTDVNGISGNINTPVGDMAFHSDLVGRYNAENILCAAGAAMALNLSLPVISAGIAAASRIPGRLESVPNARNIHVYIDYAHTPDALDNVLKELSALNPSKMICIFGCGGDRDRDKRPQMGKIVAGWCDLAIITTDNPRTEDPMDIIGQIETGMEKTAVRCHGEMAPASGSCRKGYVIEPDRKKAIGLGIRIAGPGDIVLIAGKGHETYQIVGDRTYPFDDRAVAGEMLRKMI